MRITTETFRAEIQPALTRSASASVADVDLAAHRFGYLMVTLEVTSAERDSGNETYDIYITSGDGTSKWDIVHFPQIASVGAKLYTAFIHRDLFNQNVSSASPGVAANDPAIFRTDTAGANQGIRTLGAGLVRHGALGPKIGHELVVTGTVATGILYKIWVKGVA